MPDAVEHTNFLENCKTDCSKTQTRWLLALRRHSSATTLFQSGIPFLICAFLFSLLEQNHVVSESNLPAEEHFGSVPEHVSVADPASELPGNLNRWRQCQRLREGVIHSVRRRCQINSLQRQSWGMKPNYLRHRFPPEIIGHAWTNGFVERLQGTILQEHWRVAFRRRYFTSRRQLQSSLDRYLAFYSDERPHLGYRTRGRTPSEIVWGVTPALER